MSAVAHDVPRPDAAVRPTGLRCGDAALLAGVDVLVLAPVLAVTRSPAALLLGIVAVLVWWGTGLYARRFALSVLDDLPKLAAGAFAGMGFVVLMPGTDAPVVAALAAAVLGCAATGRVAAYLLLRRARTSGRLTYPAVIVGAGPSALALAERISARPETGLCTVGFLDARPPNQPMPAPLLGQPRDLVDIVHRHRISDVIVAYGDATSESLVEVLRDCYRVDVEIHVLPRFFEMHRYAAGTDHVWGMPLETVNRRTFGGVSGYLKRGVDVVHAAAALLLLSPVIAAVALAVRLEVGPGVFFHQVRVGLDGRPFTIRKFRSMKHPPAGADTPWTVTDPARVGRVGAFIRRYSLDEIPQLVNVLTGDMSLVGPRPERPEYFEHFREEFRRYGHRARVPAGLTGLAAVEGLRGDTSIAERAYFDNLYIENWSLWLDLKIAARTVAAVLRGSGG